MIRPIALHLTVLALMLAAPTATAQTPGAPPDRPETEAPAALPEQTRKAPGTDTSAPTVAYQGVLSDGGAPVADGSYTVAVGLFGAATGGTAQYAETHTVTTVGGAFSLAIGGGTQTSGSFDAVTFADETWVEVAVGGTTLGPRTLILAAPHARSLTAGAEVVGSVVGPALRVENTSTHDFARAIVGETATPDGFAIAGINTAPSGGLGIGVYGESKSTFGRAISGFASSQSGTGYGVYGLTNSATGAGVFGMSFSSGFSPTGVEGRSNSTSGRGVVGSVSAATGVTYGVAGESRSTSGRGVSGRASATEGSTIGVYGSSASEEGRGVYGAASSQSGTTTGVYGVSASEDGQGVYGVVSRITGTNSGVAGRSESTSGRGVYGLVPQTSGTTFGVFGQSESTSGRGVYGLAAAASGSAYGVYGQSASTSGRGVYGESTATTGSAYGVRGQSASLSGSGVSGHATATFGVTTGVFGQSESTSGRAVFGEATATSGTTYGVYGAVGSPDGYPGYFIGGQGIYVDAQMAGHGANVLSDGGTGLSTSTIHARNTSSAAGIAAWFETVGTDATLVLGQNGSGDIIKAFKSGNVRFRVQNNGNVSADGSFSGGGADLAEYFPLADGAQASPGQVVGLTGGRVSLSTDGAEQVAVISSNPAFIGNPDAADGGALVALVGQVEVHVFGAAAAGDLLIASGVADGRARAVSPAAYTPADGAVLGRVLSADGERVVALVGVDEAAALRSVVSQQAERLDQQQADLDALRDEVLAIRALLGGAVAERVMDSAAGSRTDG